MQMWVGGSDAACRHHDCGHLLHLVRQQHRERCATFDFDRVKDWHGRRLRGSQGRIKSDQIGPDAAVMASRRLN